MRFLTNVLVISLLIVFLVHTAFAVTYQEAANQVTDADQALRSAFVTTVDAEQSGANVSVLLSRLTEAGYALTEAQDALGSGNYTDAVDFAGTCKSKADEVAGDAIVLKNDAAKALGNWWIPVSFSVAGSVAFAVILWLVWRRFGRTYVDKMLKSRPEVTG